jgi:hypothetical protein
MLLYYTCTTRYNTICYCTIPELHATLLCYTGLHLYYTLLFYMLHCTTYYCTLHCTSALAAVCYICLYLYYYTAYGWKGADMVDITGNKSNRPGKYRHESRKWLAPFVSNSKTWFVTVNVTVGAPLWECVRCELSESSIQRHSRHQRHHIRRDDMCYSLHCHSR